MTPEAGLESDHPGANEEKKTMKAIKSRQVAAPASRPKAEILCTLEHQIADDSSPTAAVPLHLPSRASSPSGDVSFMLPRVCVCHSSCWHQIIA